MALNIFLSKPKVPSTHQLTKEWKSYFFYWYSWDAFDFPWQESNPPFQTDYSKLHLYENKSFSKTLAVFLDFPYSAHENMWENSNSCIFLNTFRHTIVLRRVGRTPWFSTGSVMACKYNSHWEHNNHFVLMCTAEQEVITEINLNQTLQKCFCFFSFCSWVIFTAGTR